MKKFHVGDVLSITGDKLISPRLMAGVYDVLNYMTGENLYTHQLIRARDACVPYLLKQHPNLATANLDGINAENWKSRLAELVSKYGEYLEIEPLPKGLYIPIDPLTELETMVEPSKIIVISPK